MVIIAVIFAVGCSPVPVPVVAPVEDIHKIVIGVGLSGAVDICFEEWNLTGTKIFNMNCITLADMRSFAKLHGSQVAN